MGPDLRRHQRQPARRQFGWNSCDKQHHFAGSGPGCHDSRRSASCGGPVVPVADLPSVAYGQVRWFRGVNFFDPGAGRPPRQNQWSIGIQREITKDLVVEASYVGNRGVWWQAPSLLDINAITPSILAAHGLNLSDPNTTHSAFHSVESGCLGHPGAIRLGAPYARFRDFRIRWGSRCGPFPQFANIPASGDPLGKTWYDSLQTKLTKRFSHGLTGTATYTWQKSLDVGVDGQCQHHGSQRLRSSNQLREQHCSRRSIQQGDFGSSISPRFSRSRPATRCPKSRLWVRSDPGFSRIGKSERC